MIDRRGLLGAGLGLGAAALARPLRAEGMIDLGLTDGGGKRPLTTAFPGKGEMILQRTRPPLLETPMEVFDRGVFTPNDRFFVRWHWADIPQAIDVDSYRLAVRGHVERPQSLSLETLLRGLPRVELAAVNQCSGNARALFAPRVPGAQWGNGAMGNAMWAGVRLRDVLDRAGVRRGAVAVRFTGLDKPLVATAPQFVKSIDIDHARDGEVMLAFAMNGEQLPMLNGFPLRLIVPGWYSTYWIKMLHDIEVLDAPDDGYWMAKAYRIPATHDASVPPGAKDFPTVPISRMLPRAFITSLHEGQRVQAAAPLKVRGIAMGGASGVARVDISIDGGASWHPAALGPDAGRYGFRRWQMTIPARRGPITILARCTNTERQTQGMEARWNPSGFMRNVLEPVRVVAA